MKTLSQLEETPLRLLTAEQVGELLGVSKSHVNYLRRSDPTFPKPLKLGRAFNSAARYAEPELHEWIAARMTARAADAARMSAHGARMAERLNIPPGKQRGGRRKKTDAAATADAT